MKNEQHDNFTSGADRKAEIEREQKKASRRTYIAAAIMGLWMAVWAVAAWRGGVFNRQLTSEEIPLLVVFIVGAVLPLPIKGLIQAIANRRAQVVTEWARVASRSVTHDKEGGKTYYVVFQLDNGLRKTVINRALYTRLLEGDRGRITLQGTRFVDFTAETPDSGNFVPQGSTEPYGAEIAYTPAPAAEEKKKLTPRVRTGLTISIVLAAVWVVLRIATVFPEISEGFHISGYVIFLFYFCPVPFLVTLLLQKRENDRNTPVTQIRGRIMRRNGGEGVYKIEIRQEDGTTTRWDVKDKLFRQIALCDYGILSCKGKKVLGFEKLGTLELTDCEAEIVKKIDLSHRSLFYVVVRSDALKEFGGALQVRCSMEDFHRLKEGDRGEMNLHGTKLLSFRLPFDT